MLNQQWMQLGNIFTPAFVIGGSCNRRTGFQVNIVASNDDWITRCLLDR